MREESANPDACLSALASHQHGVVAIDQLRDAGLKRSAISRRVKSGRLHRIHRGVYAVGHRRLTFKGKCAAAVLACGPSAAVSHISAAVLWKMLRPVTGPIHVTVPHDNGRKAHRGIDIHRSETLEQRHLTRRHGIALTRPTRTLRDLHRAVDRSLYLRAVRQSLDQRLIREDQLRSPDGYSRSGLERRFIALCRRHRLPAPLVNSTVAGFEVDFLWIDHRLIVETDGWGTHGNRASFEADRARDAELQALGYRVVRFTYLQVFNRSREVVTRLRELLAS